MDVRNGYQGRNISYFFLLAFAYACAIFARMMMKNTALLLTGLLLLSACNAEPEASFPKPTDLQRAEKRGKLTGDGLTIGGDSADQGEGNSPIGVNSFLWRATLDTVAFMPLASADPFGGVILTDWYEDQAVKGERFKLNILILDRQLRADSVKVTAFRQMLANGVWQDASVNPDTARKIEDSILTRARELRVKQGAK
jgi:hypothetical protein